LEITHFILSIEAVCFVEGSNTSGTAVSCPYTGWLENLEYTGFWICGNLAFKIVLSLSVDKRGTVLSYSRI